MRQGERWELRGGFEEIGGYDKRWQFGEDTDLYQRLTGEEDFWDATTCHNPSIHKVDGKYALFYMGNSNGSMNTKRIGLATSHSG